MNIYDQINQIFDNNPNEPKWTKDIIEEIRELKIIINDLKNSKNYQNNNNCNRTNSDLMQFVNELREKKKPNIDKNIYPKIEYLGYTLGIDLRGYLYDMDTSKILSREDAFEIYKDMYNLQKSRRFDFFQDF
jgi:hypothetical protein